MDEQYRRSHLKTTDVECRVCSKALIQQNYQTHLKRKHPDEDCNDLRPRDRRTIVSFFGKPSKKVRDDPKEGEGASIVQSLEKNTATDDEFYEIQGPDKLNENESEHKEECEAKGKKCLIIRSTVKRRIPKKVRMKGLKVGKARRKSQHS